MVVGETRGRLLVVGKAPGGGEASGDSQPLLRRARS